jgi:hypothetical protein
MRTGVIKPHAPGDPEPEPPLIVDPSVTKSSLDPHADPEVTELAVRDRTVRAVVLPALDRLLAA